MKVPKIKLAFILLIAAFLLPQASKAATAIAVTDNTGLFVINFDFIAGDEDYLIPIGAISGLAYNASSSMAGFAIFSGDEGAVVEKSAGITLSNQEVVDSFYYRIKAGERASFKTIVIATVPETMHTTQYRAQLTHMPYLDGETRTRVPMERLTNFKSDTILLNKVIIGNGVKVEMK